MKARMSPNPARIKDDLDTIFVAIDRLKVHGYEYRWDSQGSDLNLANRALIALANVRERLANSVPAEQGEMEGMAVHASGDPEQDAELEEK